MAKIENLTATYTIDGLEKVRTLISELEDALSRITVSVVWSDSER